MANRNLNSAMLRMTAIVASHKDAKEAYLKAVDEAKLVGAVAPLQASYSIIVAQTAYIEYLLSAVTEMSKVVDEVI